MTVSAVLVLGASVPPHVGHAVQCAAPAFTAIVELTPSKNGTCRRACADVMLFLLRLRWPPAALQFQRRNDAGGTHL